MFNFQNYCKFSFLVLSLAFIYIFSSCKKNNQIEQKFQSVDSFSEISVDTVKALFASYEKPDCHLTLSFSVPHTATSTKTLESTKSMIIALTNNGAYSNDNNDIEKMINKYISDYIMDYLQEGANSIKELGSEMNYMSSWMSYESSCKGSVLYNNLGLFSYSVVEYSYTGGAHGQTKNNVATMDLATRNILNLSDLFSEEKINELKNMIYERVSEGYTLLTEEVEVPENFYLDDTGINFVYNAYDIAAYSDGEINLNFSWDVISPMISENSVIKNNPIVKQPV